jgi:hypothetical protein
MLHKIKIPFGFSTIALDNLFTIYTGKIRIKANNNFIKQNLAHHKLLIIEQRDDFTTLKFVTTDNVINKLIIKDINRTLAIIMHQRIDEKYGYYNSLQVHYPILSDDLISKIIGD